MSTSYNAFTCFGLKYKNLNTLKAIQKLILKYAIGIKVVPASLQQKEDLKPGTIAKISTPGDHTITILYRAPGQIKTPRFNPANGQKIPDLVTNIHEHAWILLNGQLIEQWYNFSPKSRGFLAKPNLPDYVAELHDECSLEPYFTLLPGVKALTQEDSLFITVQDLFFSCSQYEDEEPLSVKLPQILSAAEQLKKVASQLEECGFPKSEPELFAEFTAD